MSPLPLLTWRFALAAVILGTLAVRRNPAALKAPKGDLLKYLALSWLGFGMGSLTFFFALKYADAAVVAGLLYAYPAFVTVAAHFIFKEDVPASRWLAIAIVFIGCVLVLNVLGGEAQVSATGALLGVGAALSYAAFNLMSQRWLPGRSSMTMMSYVFGFAAVGFAGLTLASGGTEALFEMRQWPASAWALMAAIIVIPTIASTLLYLRGIRQLGASQAGVLSTFEPLFTVLLAWAVLGEQLVAVQIVGILFIVGGVAASTVISREVEPSPVVPVAPDEVAPRRADWVGPDGEPAPDYVLEEIARAEAAEQLDVATVATATAPRLLSPKARKKRRIAVAILSVVGTLITIQVLVSGAFVWWLSTPLPDISTDNISARSSMPTVILAADGTEIARWTGDENRIPVTADQIPQLVMDATAAIEDKRFWDHSGLDLRGIARALKRNYEEGIVKQGGSTITQQLIKMLYTSGERTVERKIDEALMAARVEMGYDKRHIMTSYLNMAYFGQGAYGIESAAERYFDKSVAELTVGDAAMLAGLLHSPSRYDAFEDPQPVIDRRNVVLSVMLEEGLISRGEYETIRESELGLAEQAPPAPSDYPYFVEHVRLELIDRFGTEVVAKGGLEVHTTLDPALQAEAEEAAAEFAGRKDPEVAMVSVRNKDGAIVSMVGGRDWDRNQFNLATQGKRQPGSSFKPFVLAAALEAGKKLSDTYPSSPYSVQVKDEMWNVKNYSDSRSSGAMTLAEATVWSVNTVYARLIMDIGPAPVVETARALGITSQLDPDPAIALGGLTHGVSPLEMASAYATLDNQGKYVEPTSVVMVYGRDGEVLYSANPDPVQAVSAATARAVSSTLEDVVSRGTGTAADIGGSVAGKTGTNQSYRDAWFVGWANGVSTAVWMGYPDAQVDMVKVRGRVVTGGSFPAQIWATYMRAARAARPEGSLEMQSSDRLPAVNAALNGAGRATSINPAEDTTLESEVEPQLEFEPAEGSE